MEQMARKQTKNKYNEQQEAIERFCRWCFTELEPASKGCLVAENKNFNVDQLKIKLGDLVKLRNSLAHSGQIPTDMRIAID
jgi:hypothetical protein